MASPLSKAGVNSAAKRSDAPLTELLDADGNAIDVPKGVDKTGFRCSVLLIRFIGHLLSLAEVTVLVLLVVKILRVTSDEAFCNSTGLASADSNLSDTDSGSSSTYSGNNLTTAVSWFDSVTTLNATTCNDSCDAIYSTNSLFTCQYLETHHSRDCVGCNCPGDDPTWLASLTATTTTGPPTTTTTSVLLEEGPAPECSVSYALAYGALLVSVCTCVLIPYVLALAARISMLLQKLRLGVPLQQAALEISGFHAITFAVGGWLGLVLLVFLDIAAFIRTAAFLVARGCCIPCQRRGRRREACEGKVRILFRSCYRIASASVDVVCG